MGLTPSEDGYDRQAAEVRSDSSVLGLAYQAQFYSSIGEESYETNIRSQSARILRNLVAWANEIWIAGRSFLFGEFEFIAFGQNGDHNRFSQSRGPTCRYEYLPAIRTGQ